MKPDQSFGNVEGITYFPGNGQSDKPVCIMGSIHGNERVGAAVLKELREILSTTDLRSDVYLVLGNPEAYRADKRYIDTDMNRLFGADRDVVSPGDNVEEKRVAEIAPVLSESHYLLDIHSTISPSVPFVYCEPDAEHMSLATLMGVEYIVSPPRDNSPSKETLARAAEPPSPDFRPVDLISSADNFVDRHGGLGITFESGWHKNELAVEDVLMRIKLFLQRTGACDFGLPEPENVQESKRLTIYNHVVPQSNSFTFARAFSSFDIVKAGELIGNDDNKEVRAEEDSFIIFPKTTIEQGKIACYLAHVS
ncbi:MAG: succinylglutamate desuccinylase/aspartoacylase family protein [Candidatus Peregrinibacteria bacterium]|nr:succinylglutamate desuccinylase/aspartoacylase family protein [Candidatus Peregrinibacteria bacterium]